MSNVHNPYVIAVRLKELEEGPSSITCLRGAGHNKKDPTSDILNGCCMLAKGQK